jgi:hypothetical protein
MAILNGQDVRASETRSGAGWQDEAVIQETGMCSWGAGNWPDLYHQDSGEWLNGLMLIKWTGHPHSTADLVNHFHDLQAIRTAGNIAYTAHLERSVEMLAEAINQSYKAQLHEGMEPLPPRIPYPLARKYLGSGHGGYALYLFESKHERDAWECLQGSATIPIEPWYHPGGLTDVQPK